MSWSPPFHTSSAITYVSISKSCTGLSLV
jgi:hypothetical protein